MGQGGVGLRAMRWKYKRRAIFARPEGTCELANIWITNPDWGSISTDMPVSGRPRYFLRRAGFVFLGGAKSSRFLTGIDSMRRASSSSDMGGGSDASGLRFAII
jgi:hypothetical protein